MNDEYKEVNVEETLNRLGVNEDFLKKLIKKFLDSDLLDKTEENFKSNNIESARIDIHSIKGTSANLGLIGISKLALDIENKIKEDQFLDLELLKLMREIWNESKVNIN